ncbi:MAG TPA: hypothetical protein VGW98_02900 [Solirubrobacteraceae bacterium]|jgi:hypothetical protein|nr:hypothetical protein [Solirubrobacteraceae bacterium]
MTTATLTRNKRPEGTFVDFPVDVKEDDSATPEDEQPTTEDRGEFGEFVDTTAKLLKVSKGEMMSREIDSDPAEAEALRRARQQVREGRTHGQDEVDKRLNE